MKNVRVLNTIVGVFFTVTLICSVLLELPDIGLISFIGLLFAYFYD